MLACLSFAQTAAANLAAAASVGVVGAAAAATVVDTAVVASFAPLPLVVAAAATLHHLLFVFLQHGQQGLRAHALGGHGSSRDGQGEAGREQSQDGHVKMPREAYRYLVCQVFHAWYRTLVHSPIKLSGSLHPQVVGVKATVEKSTRTVEWGSGEKGRAMVEAWGATSYEKVWRDAPDCSHFSRRRECGPPSCLPPPLPTFSPSNAQPSSIMLWLG